MQLQDLKPGDKVRGFRHWECVPMRATRTVHSDDTGLYVACTQGRHYLDGQEGDDGHLIGMVKAVGRHLRADAP